MLRRCLLVLSLAACAESRPSGSTAARAPETCWPVAPMRLIAEHGSTWEPVAEMQGDGSIYALRHGERHFYGRVSKDALLDAYETPTFTCVHREIGLPGSPSRGRYDSADAFIDDSTRIAIGNDGTVTMNGRADHARIEGPIGKTRRTAVLLVMAAMSQ